MHFLDSLGNILCTTFTFHHFVQWDGCPLLIMALSFQMSWVGHGKVYDFRGSSGLLFDLDKPD
jgi:hypothetical protein